MSANLQSFCQTKKCFADYFAFSPCFFAHLGIKQRFLVCRVYAEWLVCPCRTYRLLSARGTFVYGAGREARAAARLWRGRGVRVVSDKSDKVHTVSFYENKGIHLINIEIHESAYRRTTHFCH